AFFITQYDYLIRRYWFVTPIKPMEYAVTGIGILLILEACRRTVGTAFVTLVIAFLGYVFAGPYLPGFLAHRGVALNRVIDQLFLTTEGIFGVALGVSATYVFIFILFGSF